MTGQGVDLQRVSRALLADLLDDAARTLRKGSDADAEALALHLVKLDGPHRSAWSKLAPMTLAPGQCQTAQALVIELIWKAHDGGGATQ